ncbi:MAG: hypothetical protein C4530_10200 [Desulfobacteraceae bacterium]|nr:MAG: hypothetical protein C4530_10200 [Desulfobacteraceae bacterium]
MKQKMSKKAAAEFIGSLRFEHRREPAIPQDLRPLDTDAGYRIQEEVVERLTGRFGGKPVGYKVACTNRLAQEFLGIRTPFYGRLLSSFFHSSPVRLKGGDFPMRLIETEFAFELAQDLPSKGSAYQVEEVSAATAAVIPAIEIVETCFTDWTVVGAPSLISDNACHGAWIRGESFRAWKNLDLGAHEATLFVNGEGKLKGQGSAVLGHPLNSLTWLANALIDHGKSLKKGDLVSTGVCTDVYYARPNDHIVADFGKIGAVELIFVES